MRLLATSCIAAVLCLAQNPKAPAKNDISEMPADVHAPIFRAPKVPEAGSLTHRVTSALPKPQSNTVKAVRRNFIDKFLFDRMEREAIPYAPMATDREFLRRVRLDLTGRIPTTTELREFLADTSAGKRARLIDKLIGSDEFVDKWAYYFMDVLRANGKMGRAHTLFHYVVKESLAADRPYDDLVRSIIAASGKSNYVVAAANPIVREHVEGKPGEAEHGDDLRKIQQLDTHDELTILYGKVFLGVNLSCISCHDGAAHLEKVNVYLASKKRSDFFQQSAFLGRTRYIPHVEKSEAVMGPSSSTTSLPATTPRARVCCGTSGPGGPDAEVSVYRRASESRRRPPRRAGAHAHGKPAIRPRHRESVLGEAHGARNRGTVRRVRPRASGSG